MTRPDTSPRFVTKRALARHFECSIRTIDNWMAEGIIPYLKVGRLVRFRIDAVEASLDKFNQSETKPLKQQIHP